jgi:hypothetical protein
MRNQSLTICRPLAGSESYLKVEPSAEVAASYLKVEPSDASGGQGADQGLEKCVFWWVRIPWLNRSPFLARSQLQQMNLAAVNEDPTVISPVRSQRSSRLKRVEGF